MRPGAPCPLLRGGPVTPKTCWLVVVFWLLREIELASLRLHTRWVTVSVGSATLRLPMSKADTWGPRLVAVGALC